MLTVTTEIEINAPAHIVWNIMDDLDSYGEWNKVVPAISGRTTLGQNLAATFAPDGKAQNIKPLIHRLVALRALNWETKIPILLKADHGFLVEPINDNRCKFTNYEDFGGLIPKLLWKKIKPSLDIAYSDMNIALKERAEAIYQKDFSGSLHPSVDKGVAKASDEVVSTSLHCRCSKDPIHISINAKTSSSYLSGLSDDWKPEGSLFSLVAMVPSESLSITANEQKLKAVASGDQIKRYACSDCGVTMLGRIEDTNDALFGLDYVYPEHSNDEGWTAPTFAAYVSNIVEAGTKPQLMTGIRKRLLDLGLPPSDALSSELMDRIAAHNKKS